MLADSKNGYTYNFDIYTGRRQNEIHRGLSYDVVMKLTESLQQQGYHLYCDNFYTSMNLLKDLKANGILACGTASANRRDFPDKFKKTTKAWGKKAKRGNMRWERNQSVGTLQWKDNKLVTVMSTIHAAHDAGHTMRRVKENGRFSRKIVRQPKAVPDYNQYMNGVDRSDQLISRYHVLRKTIKWWKTLFFHMIDISVVNSYILFKSYQKTFPSIEALKRDGVYPDNLSLERSLSDRLLRIQVCQSLLKQLVIVPKMRM